MGNKEGDLMENAFHWHTFSRKGTKNISQSHTWLLSGVCVVISKRAVIWSEMVFNGW